MDGNDSQTEKCSCGLPLSECVFYGSLPDEEILAAAKSEDEKKPPIRLNVISRVLPVPDEVLEAAMSAAEAFADMTGRRDDIINAMLVVHPVRGLGVMFSWAELPKDINDYPLQKPYGLSWMVRPDSGALGRWQHQKIDRPNEDIAVSNTKAAKILDVMVDDMLAAFVRAFGRLPIGVPFGPSEVEMTAPGGIPLSALFEPGGPFGSPEAHEEMFQRTPPGW